jgi:hypothetical protein
MRASPSAIPCLSCYAECDSLSELVWLKTRNPNYSQSEGPTRDVYGVSRRTKEDSFVQQFLPKPVSLTGKYLTLTNFPVSIDDRLFPMLCERAKQSDK